MGFINRLTRPDRTGTAAGGLLPTHPEGHQDGSASCAS
jgi:hypothetical protein